MGCGVVMYGVPGMFAKHKHLPQAMGNVDAMP